MRPDSSVVDTMHVWNYGGWAWGIERRNRRRATPFPIRRESADYIRRFEHPNYETIRWMPTSAMWDGDAEH